MTDLNNLPYKVENTTSDTTGKDITNEVEVDDDEVKIFKIEELVPSSTPLTVPYLEVYRTNELEYIPYMSPYNVGVSSSSDDSSSSDTGTDTSSDTSSDTNSDTNSDSSNNNDSSDTSSNSNSNS
jgi:hypothetical protein